MLNYRPDAVRQRHGSWDRFSSLLWVMAEGLMRKVCSKCGVERSVSADERKLLAEIPVTESISFVKHATAAKVAGRAAIGAAWES